MSEGLQPEKDEDANEEEDDDPVVRSVNPPVQNKKKTRVQRNKQKAQRAFVNQKNQEKREKKKVSDIYRLKLLDRQLVAKERKEKMLREKKLKKQARQALGPKSLSRIKFEPLEPDFKLADELTGNLRNAAPAGNLLKDRFNSLQLRNIVAPTKIKL